MGGILSNSTEKGTTGGGPEAKGIDPQNVGAVRPESARWIAPEAMPDLVRALYPEGCREGTFAALYTYWPERKQALVLWHEKLARLESAARQQVA